MINSCANFLILLIIAMIIFGALTGVRESHTFFNGKHIYFVGNMSKNKVTITVSVYKGAEYLERMLDIFDQYNVKTTFFISGFVACKYSDQVIKIRDYGHEIGSLGFSKSSAQSIDEKSFKSEIKITEDILFNLCGIKTSMYAPPVGVPNSVAVNVCEKLGYKIIMRSREINDLVDNDYNTMIYRATHNIRSGDVILIHPTLHTLKALPKVLEYFSGSNFDLVFVSKNLEPIVY
jgi:peptidoglycan/xylan/chitin deacetylase (PgdA/CDA1 family)